ncbi:MAG: DUF433 domain-containing protein [Caldilineaceae bacterium]
MKQITIQVQDDQQAERIVDMLSDFDTIISIDVDPLWTINENTLAPAIIESEMGPMINHSRVSVYDVMEADDEGYSIEQIRQIYTLSSSQVEAALDYIAQHRTQLEPELKDLQRQLMMREQHYRALAAERERAIPSTMTPARATLKALIAESRRQRGAL